MLAVNSLLCKRCGIGVDDDQDGDCAICVHLPIYTLLCLRERVGEIVNAAANIGRQSTFGEMDSLLRTTSETNPVLALFKYRQRHPKHGDFDREYRRSIEAQVEVTKT